MLRWVRGDADPWRRIGEGPTPESLSRVDAVDWLVPTTSSDERLAVDRAGRALFAAAPLMDSRIYLEPLRAMDRTMDPAPGLLDRRCNPTPAFNAVRSLNTVLFGTERRWHRVTDRTVDGVDLLGLASGDLEVWLALPPAGGDPVTVEIPGGPRTGGRRWTVSLTDARSRSETPDGAAQVTVEIDEPTLVAVEPADTGEP